MTRTRLSRAVLPLLLLALPLVGCQKFRARVEFRKGAAAYKEEKYKEAVVAFKRGLQLDPEAAQVWRSVGLAAMASYRPGNDDPDNVAWAKEAADAFSNYLKVKPDDVKVLDYLVTTLINTKRYDEALVRLRADAAAHPEKPELKAAIINVMIRAGKWEEAFQTALRDKKGYGFEPFYNIAVLCWDKAYRDPSIDNVARAKFVDLGLRAINQALEMKPDSAESMAYINLLYREQAKLQEDPVKYDEFMAKADEWRAKAVAAIEAKKAADQAAIARETKGK